MTLHSAVRAMRVEFRARSTIQADSGAIAKRNADAWRITLLMLVIVIESYIIDYGHDYEHAMSAPRFFR
jgi:hypothetical protein